MRQSQYQHIHIKTGARLPKKGKARARRGRAARKRRKKR